MFDYLTLMTFWLYVFLVGYKEETTNLRTPANWYFRGANSSSHAYENYDRHRLLNLPNFSRPKWLYQLVCVLYVSLQKLQKMVWWRRHLPIKTEEEEPLVKSFYGSPRGSEKKNSCQMQNFLAICRYGYTIHKKGDLDWKTDDVKKKFHSISCLIDDSSSRLRAILTLM